ncbi:MAG: reverse transcriptase domain-containing protein [Candidatus Microgenomates bacterium]|jgi:retron-type reverse transcriptase
MKIYTDVFENIISPENLFSSWANFKHDKRKRPDVQEFEIRLEENIFNLHRELKTGIYRHGPYKPFYIHDPKQRLIHKARVRDRVVHHAIYSVLNPIFEPTFIANSFSCRIGKGTHKGVEILGKILRKVSKNNTINCFALKGDVKKFFDSIDHEILLDILEKKIKDENTIRLLKEIINSYSVSEGCGVPIGNLTSQIFANIYLNELDQFIKHELRVKYYLRYADDFVIVSGNKKYLGKLIIQIYNFLQSQLRLFLHPDKVYIRKYSQGIDFLGYIVLPHYKVVRTKTKKRIIKKLNRKNLASYMGVLSHANSFRLEQSLRNMLLKDI